ncbi:MAG: HAD family hydrolase [Prevotella sp.]|nr:HAD family hydrolase [Prevotella sp.]
MNNNRQDPPLGLQGRFHSEAEKEPPILGGIKGIIFDYGGTLDTCGQHWGKKLWHAYERQHVPVSEQQFRDAYVYGERTLGRNPIIKPDYTFHRTLATKIRLEMEHLCTHGAWDASEEEFKQKHQAVLEDVYAEVLATTAHSAEVLTQLSERFPMVLVSNFYGNIECVLQEFGLRKFFPRIVESAVVGIRKPDPRIFELGVEELRKGVQEVQGVQGVQEVKEVQGEWHTTPLPPREGQGGGSPLTPNDVLVVGDSFYKDILPAQKAGCHVAWFKGEGWTDETYDETVPDMVITDLADLLVIK